MIRTPLAAALTVALMGTSAMAAPGDASGDAAPSSAQNAPSHYDADRNAPPRDDYDDGDEADYAPPPSSQRNARGTAADSQQARADRDIFCRRDAAARTGYTTPGQAARDEQARGTIGGTLGGAALGAIIGGAAGNAGSGAAIGAGAGLLTGTIVGSSNARAAAADTERAYADAYYACMDSETPPPRSAAYGAPPPVYAYGPPPPPPVYYGYGPAYPAYPAYPYPYPYPGYYYPPYGPSVTFGFGFGGRPGWRRGYRRW
jgi:hypothetical protein